MTTALFQVNIHQYNVGHLTLHQAVDSLHRFILAKNGWEYRPLKIGSWQYDNFAHFIFSINEWCLQNVAEKKPTPKRLSKIVHASWVQNYTYWRDQKPYLTDKRYSLPKKDPFNPERDARVLKVYKDLSEEEQAKHSLFVGWYYQHLSDHIRIHKIVL